MSHTVEPFIDAEHCEVVLEAANRFIDAAYVEENIRSRRAHVYEYGLEAEVFAFPIHFPGSRATAHLPGFGLEELPEEIVPLTRRAVEALATGQGRVLWNVSRYAANAGALPPHFDGELFEFDADPVRGNTVHSGIRPREVALVTLRNESEACQTTLHAADGGVVETRTRPGELMRFDNVAYRHGVPATGPNARVPADEAAKRWIRVTMGWRAMDEGFDWNDARPLRPIGLEEAVRLQNAFMAEKWPGLAEANVERATLPFPRRYA